MRTAVNHEQLSITNLLPRPVAPFGRGRAGREGGEGGAGAARPGLKRRVSTARSLPGPAPDQPTPMAPSGPAARCGERGGPAAAGKAAR